MIDEYEYACRVENLEYALKDLEKKIEKIEQELLKRR